MINMLTSVMRISYVSLICIQHFLFHLIFLYLHFQTYKSVGIIHCWLTFRMIIMYRKIILQIIY